MQVIELLNKELKGKTIKIKDWGLNEMVELDVVSVEIVYGEPTIIYSNGPCENHYFEFDYDSEYEILN